MTAILQSSSHNNPLNLYSPVHEQTEVFYSLHFQLLQQLSLHKITDIVNYAIAILHAQIQSIQSDF